MGQLEPLYRLFPWCGGCMGFSGATMGFEDLPSPSHRGVYEKEATLCTHSLDENVGDPLTHHRPPRGLGVQKAARSPPRSLTHLLAPCSVPCRSSLGPRVCLVSDTRTAVCSLIAPACLFYNVDKSLTFSSCGMFET